MLASVAEQASLSLTWSETPEDTFSHDEAQFVASEIENQIDYRFTAPVILCISLARTVGITVRNSPIHLSRATRWICLIFNHLEVKIRLYHILPLL